MACACAVEAGHSVATTAVALREMARGAASRQIHRRTCQEIVTLEYVRVSWSRGWDAQVTLYNISGVPEGYKGPERESIKCGQRIGDRSAIKLYARCSWVTRGYAGHEGIPLGGNKGQRRQQASGHSTPFWFIAQEDPILVHQNPGLEMCENQGDPMCSPRCLTQTFRTYLDP